jgi:putative flippase GtrA
MSSSLSEPPVLVGGAGAARRMAEFVRYFAASAGALGVDTGLYRLGLQAGIAYQWAALIGFCAGAVVAYVASVAWVFEARTLRHAKLEFVLFVAIGVAGLLLTEALLWLQVERWGLPPFWGKAGAAGVVFIFNFVVRKTLLFGDRRPMTERKPSPGGAGRRP